MIFWNVQSWLNDEMYKTDKENAEHIRNQSCRVLVPNSGKILSLGILTCALFFLSVLFKAYYLYENIFGYRQVYQVQTTAITCISSPICHKNLSPTLDVQVLLITKYLEIKKETDQSQCRISELHSNWPFQLFNFNTLRLYQDIWIISGVHIL